MPIPIVLDCDPGHDDAVAMLLAAAHPGIDLRAITTVGGNGLLERVTENARRVATLAGIAGVPIAAGAAHPLGGPLETAADIHGESGLDGPALPVPTVPLDPRDGVELLIETVLASDEPVALVPTGPLTNIALALEREPRLAGRVREIVLMGGSTERGNRTPYAEFNIWVDPEAADRVFRSGVPVTMIGLNVTHLALATPDVLARLEAVGSPLASIVSGLLAFFGDTYERVFGMPHPPVHDPVAVACLAEPGVVRTVEAFVGVELTGTLTRGATVVDLHDRLGQPPNARVAVGLDVDRFWAMVVDAVAELSRRTGPDAGSSPLG